MLCLWVWELGDVRRYSHAGGEGRKRKRAAGGLSESPEEREELLGRRRMCIGWEVCMRGLGERGGSGWVSVVVVASRTRCVEAILEMVEIQEREVFEVKYGRRASGSSTEQMGQQKRYDQPILGTVGDC